MTHWTTELQKGEQVYKDQILADTWGYPKPKVDYPIKLILAWGEGEYLDFGRDLPNDCYNPFFWEDIDNWLFDMYDEKRMVSGCVYIIKATYEKFKNGKFRVESEKLKFKISN